MPKKKLDWKKIKVFTNDVESETFLRNDSHRNISKSGSQTLRCQECQNEIIHNMSVVYRFCSSVKCNTNEDDKCPFRYKIHKCDRTGASHVYETEARHLDYNIDLLDKPYGLHSVLKDEIKKFYGQRVRKPMDICITLTSNKVNNGLYQGLQLPNTDQINRQITKIRNPEDENEYERVMNQISELKYQSNKFYEADQAFCFGCKLGNGSDASHFIVNFTSIRLLESISFNNSSVTEQSIYHIDGTYKITKARYPLVVIGRSDHNGSFFPICISIVSHEQTEDFIHIFQALRELCLSLNISFNPTCFIQDACLASKNAIKTVFQSCQILMCWFHLLQNVKKNEN